MTWKNVIRGVALGDSWGGYHEFQGIKALTAQNRRGPELPSRLRVTDDTQMTLALARALHESRGGRVAEVKTAIIAHFLDYYADPDNNRAPGVTVMGSLGRLARGTHWQDATDLWSDGSGTVMRVSPAAFLSEDRWKGVAAFQAALTHGSANGIAAAILGAMVVRHGTEITPGTATIWAWEKALNADHYHLTDTGPWLDGLEVDLAKGFDTLAHLLGNATDHIPYIQAAPWSVDPCEIGGQGWRAHETLATALVAADSFPDDPLSALRRAVVSNGDSDTIGAVTGAILGALHPDPWDEELFDRLEPRYANWIRDEADHYRFTRSSWLSRLIHH